MDELTQAFLETLLRTQFLPADRMLVYQRSLIERLLRHARAQVPFYRDSGRLDVLFTADDRIDWERWDEVPILTRSEAQQHAEALYAESVPPECGQIDSGYTSGSTGVPLAFRVNTMLAAAGSATLERGLMWGGLPERLTLAWLRYDKPGVAAYPMGALYKSTIRGATRLMHNLDLQTPLEDQLRWLARLRPDVVMSYPGALAQLARNLPHELDNHLFRLAVCVGEVTTPEIRAAIEQGFRCPVMDVYSGSEFGTVAIEDRSVQRLFVTEETMFVEFAPPGDFAMAESGLAELIFTPFYNYAMPLIRYATGDFAVVDTGQAPDSRALRRLTRIAGRQRNILKLPSGKLWWPYFIPSKRLAEYLAFDRFQYVQTRRGRIELRYVSREAEPEKNAAALLAELRAAAPEPLDIVLKRVPDIARHRSGKFEEFTCEIDETKDA
jgi:phenylacetate-CoA ligase